MDEDYDLLASANSVILTDVIPLHQIGYFRLVNFGNFPQRITLPYGIDIACSRGK